MTDAVRLAAGLLRQSRWTAVLTGAGVSTESGMPDFRSAGGLWTGVDPMRVASRSAFERDPDAFYTFYRTRLAGLAGAAPNAAHRAIARLEALGLAQVVITQNVDGLHQQAGSRRVVEVHGNLREARCAACGVIVPIMEMTAGFLPAAVPPRLRVPARVCPPGSARQGTHGGMGTQGAAGGARPRCARCGGLLRPNVVLFEELLPEDAYHRAEEACLRCEVLLIVGSSLEVYPVADLPRRARARGAHLLIVNRDPTPYDRDAAALLRGAAGSLLPALVAEVKGAGAARG